MNKIETLDPKGEQIDEETMMTKFLEDTTLFLGPDPEIMNDHDLAPRTDREDEAMKKSTDPATLAIARDRILAGANEGFEMLENMGAAPGAKWGDLVTGVFTAAGDLAISSTGGVLIFSSLVHHPVKFINKYWRDEPTVGVRPGDVFMHNDARYGNIHNTDQSMLLPVFHEGELIAWAGATVHEGENGAVEPGGMPSAAESVFDEGLKLSPMKVGENYELKRDIVTYFQNTVREPKLQYEDMKVKMFVCRRIEARIREAIEEYGVDSVIACLRKGLEDTRTEVRRRISGWPDGTVRYRHFADGTLRENVMVKVNLELRKKGDLLTFDFRGSSPEFANRCNNTLMASLKGMICQLFLAFIWPDLPRCQSAFAPMKVITDDKSALNSSYLTPNAQSMMTFFPAFTAAQIACAKMMFSIPNKSTKVVAAWYDMINTFLYGGMTQHGEIVGNVCADINGMGGGAHGDRDGEHAVAPIFATMADIGEQEIVEEEVPFIQIVSKRLLTDNQGMGKYRGGMGYQMMVAMTDSESWGFMVTCIGSKTPNAMGLFGGYACPTYPLSKVKGVDVFEMFKNNPRDFPYSSIEVMNTQPFKGAKYSTHHMGLQYELTRRGELYMMAQGSGGGYGDVLERDPKDVMRDAEEKLVSQAVANKVYKVIYDPDTLVVDEAATQKARNRERAARKKRGVPFKQFVKKWTTKIPPKNLPFYGCWGDPSLIYGGSPDDTMTPDTMRSITLPHPKDVRIAELEAQLETVERTLRRVAAPKKPKSKAKPQTRAKAKPKTRAKAKPKKTARKRAATGRSKRTR
jgi:N-methylhydantoinase B/oxoprolinase/acetone carboxylase alpha subunit